MFATYAAGQRSTVLSLLQRIKSFRSVAYYDLYKEKKRAKTRAIKYGDGLVA